MEKGKQKCEKLKSIRKAFADANGVDYTPSECSSTEECRGTCPKCEAEAEYIMSKIKEGKASSNEIPMGTDRSCVDEDLEIIDVTEFADIEINDSGEILELEDELMGDIDLPSDWIIAEEGSNVIVDNNDNCQKCIYLDDISDIDGKNRN